MENSRLRVVGPVKLFFLVQNLIIFTMPPNTKQQFKNVSFTKIIPLIFELTQLICYSRIEFD